MINNIVKKMLILILILFNIIGMAACTTYADDPFIDFTYEKEEKKIETSVVVKDDLIVYDSIIARSVPINKVTHYYLGVTGYLKEYSVKLMDEVKAGDVIAVLDSSTLDKQLRDQTIKYKKAKLKYEKAKFEFESTKENKNAMLFAKLDFDYEELRYNKLSDKYKSLELKAEIDGVITKKQTHPGNFVTTKTAIADVTDSSEILVAFNSEEVSGLSIGDILNINIRNTEVDIPATVIEINKKETILRPEIVHESFKKTGALVYVNILKDKRIGALIVDEDCLVEEAGRVYVYVMENGEKSERDIRVGIFYKGVVEVLFGLEEGEIIVSRPH